MKYLLDTSAYSAFNRGDSRLLAIFNSHNDLVVPLVVLGELRAGFAAGTKRQQNEQLLQRFLDSPNVVTCGLTDKTSRLFAELYASLRQSGRTIGSNDLWIAALAIEHKMALVSLDNDFNSIEGLKLAKL